MRDSWYSRNERVKAWEIDLDGYILYEKLATNDELQDENTIFIKPPTNLYKPKWDKINQTWIEGLSPEEILNIEKSIKIKELNLECNKTILDRFTSVIDGVEYQFSNDIEAQTNFEKCDRAFEKDRMTEIAWTAYTIDGQVSRILLDKTKFENVYLAHLNHIQNNISKFRDFLMPTVEDSLTVEEVRNINWYN